MKKLLATIWLNLIGYGLLACMIYAAYGLYVTELKAFLVFITGIFVFIITIVSVKVLENKK